MKGIRIVTLLSVCLLAACNSESNQQASSSTSADGVSASTSSADRAQTASATLTWTPPLINDDGSMLTDLAGFRVYYGTDPANLSQVVDLPGASQVIYTANNLTVGTWYFSVRAYSSAGGEGTLTQTINAEVI